MIKPPKALLILSWIERAWRHLIGNLEKAASLGNRARGYLVSEAYLWDMEPQVLRQNCGEAIPQEETPLNLACRDALLTPVL